MARSDRIRNGTLIALALVVLPAGIIYFVETSGRPAKRTSDERTPQEEATSENVTSPAGEPSGEPVRPSRPQPVVVRSPDPGRSPLADKLNAPAGNIREDLAILARVFDNYRQELGGNPSGNNREITAQLSGRNQHRHAPLPKDHPAIDATGQLRDRWGKPFFFHVFSALKMEIRSAGKDRELYTDDDEVWSPGS